MKSLAISVKAWDRPRVCVVGDFMLDEYVYGDVERISPEAPVPVLRVVDREFRPGGAGNVATALAALGGEVSCFGLVSTDIAGGQLVEKLTLAGVNTDGLLADADRPTTRKTRFVGLSQHKNPHQILREDEENTTPVDDKTLAGLVSQLRTALQGMIASGEQPVVAMQDHNKGLLSGGGAQAVIAMAGELGVEVIVDPALIDDYARYTGCSFLTPNRYEAARATGGATDTPDALASVAKKILQTTGAKGVVVTLDREGALLALAGQPQRLLPPGRISQVADGTGAGDAVLAAFSVARAAGLPEETAVSLANLAGGLEVERFGVVPVTRDEMLAELDGRAEGSDRKTFTRDALADELDRRRACGGQPIVFTNGCFDLLHMGHVSYLQQARQQGGSLVVAVNSDASVQRLKGPTRPIIAEADRAAMLAALECVDYVTIFDEDTPMELLDQLRPDRLVKGGSTDVIVGEEFVQSYGGDVCRLDLVEGRSTTDIIQAIQNEK